MFVIDEKNQSSTFPLHAVYLKKKVQSEVHYEILGIW